MPGNGSVDVKRLLEPGSIQAMIAPEWQYRTGNGLTYEEDTGDADAGFFCRYGLAVMTQ